MPPITNRMKECIRAYNEFKDERNLEEEIPNAICDWVIKFPKKPQRDKIANWGKKKEDRKFPYHDKEWLEYVEGNYTEYIQGESKLYEDVNEFIDSEREIQENGFWFYNGDKLEYIAGNHYMFLQYWHLKSEEGGFSLPSFVDAQRDLWLALTEAKKHPSYAAVFFTTMRRFGKTACGSADGYFDTISNEGFRFAIQSKNDPDAAKIMDKIVIAWQRMPSFLKPVDTGLSKSSAYIDFSNPQTRSTKTKVKEYGAVLNSKIYKAPSTTVALDGDNLQYYYGDELGKCFSPDTQILMSDGSVKKVQDIKIGDYVMGEDSKPKLVSNLISGLEQMYEVIPNKGYSWGCNESHIIHAEWCDSRPRYFFGKKIKKGDRINVTVKEYNKFSDRVKKHLMLVRVGVEYEEKELKIEPYYFGAWIGDGDKETMTIYSIEPEIEKYIYDYAKRLGVTVSKSKGNKKTESFYSYSFGFNKVTSKWLTELGVRRNKHIPNQYEFSSIQQRLEFLAGIIDTDGYKPKKGNLYTVTQKYKHISEAICRIANSCGFYSTINKKVATMKRGDGSVYKCDVYRVAIFGEIYRIPCKVERKKSYKKRYHKNRRNPMRTGFSVVKKDVGRYYGFHLKDTNGLFLLSDFTIAHNCPTSIADVEKRWNVNKYALKQRAKITGFAFNTTTVEDVDGRAIKLYKNLWDNSDRRKINPETNQTETLGGRIFIPACYGYAGEVIFNGEPTNFVDEWGYSDVKKAEQYIKALRKGLVGDSLKNEMRKNPLNMEECWAVSGIENNFDMQKIMQQLSYIRDNRINSPVVRGNFFYSETRKEVVWHPSEQGKWYVRWLPPEGERNRYEEIGASYQPARMFSRTGIDPYDHQGSEDGGSKGAGITIVKDARYFPKPTIVCYYCHRPETPTQFYKDMLYQSIFYSSYAHIENNKYGIIEHWKNMGYAKYAMLNPFDSTYFKKSGNRGTPTTNWDIKNALLNYAQEYIYEYLGYDTKKDMFGDCWFEDILEEFRNFKANKWTDFDSTVAFMMAISAFHREEIKKEKKERKRGTLNIIRKTDISKQRTLS